MIFLGIKQGERGEGEEVGDRFFGDRWAISLRSDPETGIALGYFIDRSLTTETVLTEIYAES